MIENKMTHTHDEWFALFMDMPTGTPRGLSKQEAVRTPDKRPCERLAAASNQGSEIQAGLPSTMAAF